MTPRQIIQFICLTILLTFATTNSIAHEHQQLPKLTGDGTLRRIRVPILMYHYVSELPPNADDIRIGLTISLQRFREHMHYLQSGGYTTISLYEIHLALEYGIPLPQRPVVLTFDDGYIDHYINVFPILQDYGFIGTFFIVTDFADTRRPGYMSWEQIAEMAAAGMSMESHTKSHSDLRERSYDFLVYEILGSVESLTSHTSIEPHMFAFPAGRYDTDVLNVLDTTHIFRAVTTEPGTYHTTDNHFLMPRMRITPETGIGALQYLLNYGK